MRARTHKYKYIHTYIDSEAPLRVCLCVCVCVRACVCVHTYIHIDFEAAHGSDGLDGPTGSQWSAFGANTFALRYRPIELFSSRNYY
jgi:hypothetical protein